jgi:hypothetical protein
MPLAGQPEDMGQLLADIDRRLRTLETAQRAAYTSIVDDNGKEVVRLDRTGIKIYDADGDLRVAMGQLQTDRYGFLVLDPGGAIARLHIDESGILSPYLAAPFVDADTDFKPTTSAAFVATHRAQLEQITSEGLYCWVVATAPAGTTGEIRLRNVGTGAVTEAVPVPDGGQVTKQFRWLHGASLSAGPVTFEVQARRTSGAGAVNVYRPPGCWMTAPGLCVADGVP